MASKYHSGVQRFIETMMSSVVFVQAISHSERGLIQGKSSLALLLFPDACKIQNTQ